MMSFEEFRSGPKCRPLVLSDEDSPQDQKEWRRLEREDQQRQYDIYVAQHDEAMPKIYLRPEETPEEKRVNQKLTMLRNSSSPVTQHVSQQSTKSRAAYFREYRRRVKACPHCGKPIRGSKSE